MRTQSYGGVRARLAGQIRTGHVPRHSPHCQRQIQSDFVFGDSRESQNWILCSPLVLEEAQRPTPPWTRMSIPAEHPSDTGNARIDQVQA